MPLTSLPPTSGATPVTSAYAVFPMNATSNGPPPAMTLVGRPLANVVTTPDWGSTRATRPAAASATYSAPSGPTALPKLPSRPEASSTAVGGPELLAASGPSPARSSPEGGAVVWSQPAIKTPTPIATSPLEIELQSMLDFNDIIPPGLTAVMGTCSLFLWNGITPRNGSQAAACQTCGQRLCWKAPADRGTYHSHPIGGHGPPETLERGGRPRSGSTDSPGLRPPARAGAPAIAQRVR